MAAAATTALQPVPAQAGARRSRPVARLAPPRACRECVAHTAAAASAAHAAAVSSARGKPGRGWQRAPPAPLAALGSGGDSDGASLSPSEEAEAGAEARRGPGDGDDGDARTSTSTNPFLPSADDPPALAAALAALRFYKAAISPLLPPSCRFLPSCSEYAAGAYRKFGVFRGTILTAWRLLRCQPWGGRGYDPPVWPPPGLRGTGGEGV
jgi:uncharacterized protein